MATISKITHTYNSIEYLLIDRIKKLGYSDNYLTKNIQSIVTNEIVKNTSVVNFNQKYNLIGYLISLEHSEDQKSNEYFNHLNSIIKNYKATKNIEDAETIVNLVYFGQLLKLVGYTKYNQIFSKLNIESIAKEIVVSSKDTNNKVKILKLILTKEFIEISVNNQDILCLSNALLQTAIKIRIKKQKSDLLQLFRLCNTIENLAISKPHSESTIAESTLIVKASLGKGLYLPEFEVEEYLAQEVKEYIAKKYTQILKNALKINIYGLNTPIYLIPPMLFFIEWLIFQSGRIGEFSIGPLAVEKEDFKDFEIIVMYFINPSLLVAYFFYAAWRLKKTVKNVEL